MSCGSIWAGASTWQRRPSPACATRKWGRIVNIGSINGQAGQYGQVNYAAAKVRHSRLYQGACAQEGAKFGVTVNAIAPGYIDTDMVAAVPEPVLEKDRRQNSGRPARPSRGNRPRRRLLHLGERRIHDWIDHEHQWRPTYVLIGGCLPIECRQGLAYGRTRVVPRAYPIAGCGCHTRGVERSCQKRHGSAALNRHHRDIRRSRGAAADLFICPACAGKLAIPARISRRPDHLLLCPSARIRPWRPRKRLPHRPR